MSTTPKPLGKAMYVATDLERDWLQIEQRKLYARSSDGRSYVFRKLWGLITDPRNLSVAFARVAANRGKRTAGVDKITVRFFPSSRISVRISIICLGSSPLVGSSRIKTLGLPINA